MAVRQFTTWQKLFKLKSQLLISLFTSEEIRHEEWRDVDGYEGVYSVSNLGRVRRDLGGFGNAKAGKILKAAPCTGGYLLVVLSRYGRHKTVKVHRLVTIAFLGKCPEGKEVNHKKPPKWNNRVLNLEYLTHLENVKHASETRLYPFGDRNGNAKITEEDVLRVFELRNSGLCQRKIGEIIGIHQGHVSRILLGKRRRLINAAA